MKKLYTVVVVTSMFLPGFAMAEGCDVRQDAQGTWLCRKLPDHGPIVKVVPYVQEGTGQVWHSGESYIVDAGAGQNWNTPGNTGGHYEQQGSGGAYAPHDARSLDGVKTYESQRFQQPSVAQDNNGSMFEAGAWSGVEHVGRERGYYQGAVGDFRPFTYDMGDGKKLHVGVAAMDSHFKGYVKLPNGDKGRWEGGSTVGGLSAKLVDPKNHRDLTARALFGHGWTKSGGNRKGQHEFRPTVGYSNWSNRANGQEFLPEHHVNAWANIPSAESYSTPPADGGYDDQAFGVTYTQDVYDTQVSEKTVVTSGVNVGAGHSKGKNSATWQFGPAFSASYTGVDTGNVSVLNLVNGGIKPIEGYVNFRGVHAIIRDVNTVQVNKAPGGMPVTHQGNQHDTW